MDNDVSYGFDTPCTSSCKTESWIRCFDYYAGYGRLILLLEYVTPAENTTLLDIEYSSVCRHSYCG